MNTQNGNNSDDENFYMELLQNSMNTTDIIVGEISGNVNNDINDYTYYVNSNNETNNTTTKNCTLNCTTQVIEIENVIEYTNAESMNLEEDATEIMEGMDDSKTKTITLLDFSNYLIPNEENINETV